MFNRANIVLSILFILALIASLWSTADSSKHSNQTVNISINGHELSVELATTVDRRRRGLSGLEKMEPKNGLLFVFEENGYHEIWMRDMLFPLDILWLDEQFSIVTIQKQVSPESWPKVFNSTVPSRYVLETNAGWVEQNNIRVGDRVILNGAFLPEASFKP